MRKVAPPPGVSSNADAAAVRVHHRGRDAETEAAATLVSAAQRVGPVESLEDLLTLRLRDTGSVVDDVDLGVRVLRLQRHLDRASRGRVHERVAHEVRDSLAEAKVIAGHDHRVR